MEQDMNWPDAVEQPQEVSGSRHDRMVTRRVVCAAILVNDHLVCGPRHFDATMRVHLDLIDEPYSSANVAQGFIDQFGVFMDRKEAMQVAKDAGQPIDIERGCGGDETTLYSEGLY